MKVPLTQGAYTARSVVANAQRALNLYPERNTDDAESPYTHYPVPGTRLLVNPPAADVARGLYRANSGDLFYVCGARVYFVTSSWTLQQLGTIGYNTTPVSMADNGLTLVLVDGSTQGYQIDLTTRIMSPISPATNSPPAATLATYGFYGADRVDVIDTFMVFNYPGTQSFYTTYSNQVVFDSLYFAEKTGFSDRLVVAVVTRRNIFLIGEKTTEVWFNSGAADFPFQIMPGPFIQHGCIAKYSPAQIGGAIYFLSQDQGGANIVAKIRGYVAERISTHAIENEISKYSVVNDAIGFTYQQGGHEFYVLTFPAADKTWVYDDTTNLWHERAWTDTNGIQHRHRANCAAFAYSTNVIGDWQTGALYALDLTVYTDNGQPMYFRRGWPHLVDDGNRVMYQSFTADMQVGAKTTDGDAPISLRWSDTRGASWGQPVDQSMGRTGEYISQPQWNRLGMARDRVFEVFGVIPGPMAINGAFIETRRSKT